MTEGVIESIVARCLLEPAFVDAIRADAASALAPYGLDEEVQRRLAGGDLDRLQRFGGFIGKVQHNHLWESFPCTRRLLRYYGIEGDVFTAFRPLQLAQRAHAGPHDRIRTFLAFLGAFVAARAEEGLAYPGLADLVRHEYNVWELGLMTPPSPEAPIPPADLSGVPWRGFKQLIPRRNGATRIAVYAADPVEIEARVRSSSFDGRLRSSPGRQVLVYWIDRAAGMMRILAVDELAGLIISRVNDRRSVAAVIDGARRHGRAGVPPLACRALFEEAARVGFLALVRRSDDARHSG